MKLTEAIEITKDSMRGTEAFDDTAQADALKLLIEAGKRVLRTRDKRFPVQGQELPGETRE